MSWAGPWPSISEFCACSVHNLAEVSTSSPGWPLFHPSFLWTQPSAPSLRGSGYSAYPQNGTGRGAEGGQGSVDGSHHYFPPPCSVLSAMIRGAADGSRFQVLDYEEGQVEAMLDRYFEADPPLAGSCHP